MLMQNLRVSETLQRNENNDKAIKRLDFARYQQRKTTVQEYGLFLKEQDAKVAGRYSIT